MKRMLIVTIATGQPRAVVMENVCVFYPHGDGTRFELVNGTLQDCIDSFGEVQRRLVRTVPDVQSVTAVSG